MSGLTAALLPPLALPELPASWLRLDTLGHVLEGSADWAAPGRAAGIPASFASCLAPSSRLLWTSVLFPSLLTSGVLSEAVLEFLVPPAHAEGHHRISHWRRDDTAGPAPTYLGVLTSARERQRLVQELAQARRSLETIPNALLQIQQGEHGGLTFPYATSRLLDLLGVTPLQASSHPAALLEALEAASVLALQQALAGPHVAGGSWQVLLRPRRTPERQLELAACRADTPGLWHGVLTDVSEREALQHALQERAETDALTRLPNRSALLVTLQRKLRLGRRLALLYMDCDRFKQVNDSLGHEVGDELLRRVALRLSSVLRASSDIWLRLEPARDTRQDGMVAARMGGDEFVVLADGVGDAQGAGMLAERLLQEMARPYQVGGAELVGGVSIGVVVADATSQASQLLRDADTAMYEAKRAGRGCWTLFQPAMHERVASALAMERDLRVALRDGQLRPVFQPIVDMRSGSVVGMEVLARWRHPVRGDVSPAQFIPVAESAGLIAELGERILRLACRQFAQWVHMELPVPRRLSVNLSRAQLMDRRLCGHVTRILQETGLPCSRLQLEVTESLAMDGDTACQALADLRKHDIQLALDDFGTGHSSLSSLERFPVQQLKIDRSFIRDIAGSAYRRALVKASVQVARALHLEVVAEGVETVEQARVLQKLGCSRAQGWLYARALEADAVPEFLLRSAQAGRGRRKPAGAGPVAAAAPDSDLARAAVLPGTAAPPPASPPVPGPGRPATLASGPHRASSEAHGALKAVQAPTAPAVCSRASGPQTTHRP